MKFTLEKGNTLGMTTLAVLAVAVVAPVFAGFIVTDTSCTSGTRCYGGGYGDGGYGYGYGYGIGASYINSPYQDPNYGYGYTTSGSTSSSSGGGSTSSSSGGGGGGGGGLTSSSGAGTIFNTTTTTVPGYEAILAQLSALVDKTLASTTTCQSCSVNYDGAMDSASMLRSSYDSFVKVFGNYKAGKASKDEVLASFKTFATYYYDVRSFGKTCKRSCDMVIEENMDDDVLPATGAKSIKKRG